MILQNHKHATSWVNLHVSCMVFFQTRKLARFFGCSCNPVKMIYSSWMERDKHHKILFCITYSFTKQSKCFFITIKEGWNLPQICFREHVNSLNQGRKQREHQLLNNNEYVFSEITFHAIYSEWSISLAVSLCSFKVSRTAIRASSDSLIVFIWRHHKINH